MSFWMHLQPQPWQTETSRQTTASMDHSSWPSKSRWLASSHQGFRRCNPWQQAENHTFQGTATNCYNETKKDQEEEDAWEAEKPLHLKPSRCTVLTVSYLECTGSSIYQLFTKDIACHHQIYDSCEAGTYVFVPNIALISFTHDSCSFQNSRKSCEDDAAYHAWLGRISRRNMVRNLLVCQAQVS